MGKNKIRYQGGFWPTIKDSTPLSNKCIGKFKLKENEEVINFYRTDYIPLKKESKENTEAFIFLSDLLIFR